MTSLASLDVHPEGAGAGGTRRSYAVPLGLLLAFLALCFFLALISYSPDDPSFAHAVAGHPSNLLGRPGANVAHILQAGFGLASYLLPFSLAGMAARVWFTGRGVSLVAFGTFIPVLCLGAAYASAHLPHEGMRTGYGGVTGDAIITLLAAISERLGIGRPYLFPGLLTGGATLYFLARCLRLRLADFKWLASFLFTGGFPFFKSDSVRVSGRDILTRMRRAKAGLRAPKQPKLRKVWDEPVTGPDFTSPGFGEPTIAHPGRPAGPSGPDAGRGAAISDWIDIRDEQPDPGFGYEYEEAFEAPHYGGPAAFSEHSPAPARRQRRNSPGKPKVYTLPSLSLLAPVRPSSKRPTPHQLREHSEHLKQVLADYGVGGVIEKANAGPVVALHELEPDAGIKASRVIGLSDDIARSMSALSARVSTIPGRSVIGIELPNAERETVQLREILESPEYQQTSAVLPLTLGKDIAGRPVVTDLSTMPHLLIAGTTGSGKSVGINTMILSLLYRHGPERCRMIMIDPKMLELSVYDRIPHLLAPVVTDPKKAVVALKWVVREMESRYQKMSRLGVRNIDGFNERVREAIASGEKLSRAFQTGFDDAGYPIYETETFEREELPYIVVIVDEMADLMMVAGKEIEACIQRLAQMARASGIHLIMATQRPSVDVITGTIKANFPTRISFQVTSKIDSRTILGEQGAEQLLGRGDMLFMRGGGRITRVHGPFVSDEEVETVVQELRSRGAPDYVDITDTGGDDDGQLDELLGLSEASSDDELYAQAVQIAAKELKASTSYIQRRLSIGYNRAARLVDKMEEEGVVSAANHVGKREVLLPES